MTEANHFLTSERGKAHMVNASVILLLAFGALIAGAAPEWQTLAPGMELKYVAPHGSNGSNSAITILRMDPKQWELALLGTSQTGEAAGHTAREWCLKGKFTAAINAGMFSTDGKSHIGYMRNGEHVNSSKRNSYQSVAAFNPHDTGTAAFRIFDLDAPGVSFESILKDYGAVVQNLRLIKRAGVNAWPSQDKKWSEAALAEDEGGRILFIFLREPFSMHDLNQELLGAGIGIVAAQHLEGGPEAQLYFRAGGVEREMVGSYGAGASLQGNAENTIPWPIPNVLAVRPRQPAGHR
jgi:Phosphodiester glycosidase